MKAEGLGPEIVPPRLEAMRAFLIVPASAQTALDAAFASPADALILDLAGADPDARSWARAVLERCAPAPSRPRLYVRVSPLDAGIDADLAAVMPAGPDGLVLPGATGARDVAHVGALLAVHEAEHGLADGATRVVPVLDTAGALLDAASLPGSSPRLAALAWDADALAAGIGAAVARDVDGGLIPPLAQARGLIRLAAAAAGVEAVESAYPGRDESGCRRAVAAARRDGFAAMLALTPAQAALILQRP